MTEKVTWNLEGTLWNCLKLPYNCDWMAPKDFCLLFCLFCFNQFHLFFMKREMRVRIVVWFFFFFTAFYSKRMGRARGKWQVTRACPNAQMCATALWSDRNVYSVFRPLKASKVACDTFEYVPLVYFLPLKVQAKWRQAWPPCTSSWIFSSLHSKHIKLWNAALNAGKS